MPIDMWSLGCILAELLTGSALLPGENEGDQLACMIELLGMPPPHLLEQSKRARNFITAKGHPRYCGTQTLEDGTVILCAGVSRRGKTRGPPGTKTLTQALKGCTDELFLSFLEGCLKWDPEVRMTPEEALRHPWFRRRLPKAPGENCSGGQPPSPGGSSSAVIPITPNTGSTNGASTASNPIKIPGTAKLERTITGDNTSDEPNSILGSSSTLQHSNLAISKSSSSKMLAAVSQSPQPGAPPPQQLATNINGDRNGATSSDALTKS